MKNFNLKKEDGRSMIEMLGVLAIIGVLSVGGIAGYSKAMHKYRVNKAIEQITLIAGNIRAFFAPQRNYDGLGWCSNDNDATRANCKLIKKAKLMPDEMWDDTTKSFKNVFGLWVMLFSAHKSTNTDTQAFSMTYYTDREYEACVELLTYDWTPVGVKGIAVKVAGPGFLLANKTVPVNLDDAVNTCYSPTNDYLYLEFYFDVNSNCWSETNGNTCS